MDFNAAHVLLLPFVAPGHFASFMKLGHHLADAGAKVTLLTTEFIHTRIEMFSMPNLGRGEKGSTKIVSVPDGLASEDDRKDETKVAESITRVMPGHMEDLIKKGNEQGGDAKITCVIADSVFGWALEIAEKMGVKHAVFFSSSPGNLAMVLHIPKLIEAGIIDPHDGTSRKDVEILISANLPVLRNADFMWNCPGNSLMQRMAFHYELLVNRNLKAAKWVLGNWFHELDSSAKDLLPNIVPVGPLLANEQPIGNFWPEDISCLSWLDRQSPRSVIYVAFGSTSKLSQLQFNELATGLELMDRPFLFVVRTDLANGLTPKFPDGFSERIANRAKIVQWAPQEKVLTHPSIACFLTHCGWNSTLEAISMGVPMLCWPYFTDQFYIRSCVCSVWKIGLELSPDETGIVTRQEVRKKVDDMLSDDDIRSNVIRLKELAQKNVSRGGSSSKNLETFIAEIMV